MYTRVVELVAKSGQAPALCDVISADVLPILKKQAGFVDETVLLSNMEPERVLALSFWNGREDAERYVREEYPRVHQLLVDLLEAEPVIRTFEVHTSTVHRIAAGKAA
jgi:heme-degrading monooxygenase HmoA